jgi:hypothetical protein
MNTQLSNAAPAAAQALEVFLDNRLFKRVSEQSAKFMVARGWAEWRGTGNRRHLELTDAAPLSTLQGRSGVQRTRADYSCRVHAEGQRLGFAWEHRR